MSGGVVSERSRKPSLELVAQAQGVPGGWVYEIDGVYEPHEAVPPEANRGAWAVLPDGALSGHFEPNPGYRPRCDRWPS